MGKDVGFYMVSRKTGSDLKSENLVSCLANILIRWMSRPQNWSKVIKNTMFTAYEGTVILSTKRNISQTASVSYSYARHSRVVLLELV